MEHPDPGQSMDRELEDVSLCIPVLLIIRISENKAVFCWRQTLSSSLTNSLPVIRLSSFLSVHSMHTADVSLPRANRLHFLLDYCPGWRTTATSSAHSQFLPHAHNYHIS